MKRELSKLEESTPVIQLVVSVDEKLLKAGCDEVQASFSRKSEHYLNIHTLGSSEAFHKSNCNQLELKVESSTLTEINSVQDLLISERAIAVKSNQVFYPVRSVPNGEMEVSVTVMGKHIVSSPTIVNMEDTNAAVDETNSLMTLSLAVDTHYEKEECST